ncbi:hypothetical protein BO71DRAFT_114485 [Aspergillus ellipticus CBS 707.79]|uniref:Uncharacterized protein n=1 Tax=Aspergillus ellipticus CBS 707.79 TaxID=1448320 RepID=A0A319EA87_9EURO|nr:hypothetical protein BO71DRAFT_114485 [Aspergillus ellipticus CBS 707.79]
MRAGGRSRARASARGGYIRASETEEGGAGQEERPAVGWMEGGQGGSRSMAETVASPKRMQIPWSELRYHWKPKEGSQRGDEARLLDRWRQRKRNDGGGPRESVGGVTLTATMDGRNRSDLLSRQRPQGIGLQSARGQSARDQPREDGWRAEEAEGGRGRQREAEGGRGRRGRKSTRRWRDGMGWDGGVRESREAGGGDGAASQQQQQKQRGLIRSGWSRHPRRIRRIAIVGGLLSWCREVVLLLLMP